MATCFTYDSVGRHYIITARHVVHGLGAAGRLDIFRNGHWDPIPVRLVGKSEGDEDIAVLAPENILTPLHELVYGRGSFFYSQDIYFLGFPYGYQGFIPPEANNGLPLPVAKKGIISDIGSPARGHRRLLLDGHNNPGFSGGPVVYELQDGSRRTGVCGVISGYQIAPEEVVMKDTGFPTGMVLRANTGIVIATEMTVAIEIIAANPIGFPIA